jgi:hypothetical protein
MSEAREALLREFRPRSRKKSFLSQTAQFQKVLRITALTLSTSPSTLGIYILEIHIHDSRTAG